MLRSFIENKNKKNTYIYHQKDKDEISMAHSEEKGIQKIGTSNRCRNVTKSQRRKGLLGDREYEIKKNIIKNKN